MNVRCRSPHPEDEDTVQPDEGDGDEAQTEGQAPDQAQAVGVRVLLGDGLDVADAEQDEQNGDVGEVAHALPAAWSTSARADPNASDLHRFCCWAKANINRNRLQDPQPA